MRKLTFSEACFQWASGFYLAEHVPDKFFDWIENGQYPRREDYDN